MKYTCNSRIFFYIFLTLQTFLNGQNTPKPFVKVTKADSIIAKAIDTHGGGLYDQASYEFVFRNNTYTFANTNKIYLYSVRNKKADKEIIDVLDNNGFKRIMNGNEIILSKKEIDKLTGALNSVIYFATLPHKLRDEAVKSVYRGRIVIKNEPYHILEITFGEENGGQDHEDVFYYWIHENNNTLDYLAYKYHVNSGGVRFRSAYNIRTIDGIRFQDYINYKANKGTPLETLPRLWEQGALEELSRIETENIKNLNH